MGITERDNQNKARELERRPLTSLIPGPEKQKHHSALRPHIQQKKETQTGIPNHQFSNRK